MNIMEIGSLANHREREKGVLVYPVYSRRSGGLSIGLNLFPEQKECSFNCPYCEVYPFKSSQKFSLSLMETALREAISNLKNQGMEIKDIGFSGNGEPTLSPFFPAALESAFTIRNKEIPKASLVLITNGTGLLNEKTFDLLRTAAEKGLDIWLKLDAATESWYKIINRSSIPYEQLMKKIRSFIKCAPVTLQTIICSINDCPPPTEEEYAREALILELASSSKNIKLIQIYGKARPSPEDPLAGTLPDIALEARADSIRAALAAAGKEIPVKVFF